MGVSTLRRDPAGPDHNPWSAAVSTTNQPGRSGCGAAPTSALSRSGSRAAAAGRARSAAVPLGAPAAAVSLGVPVTAITSSARHWGVARRPSQK